MITPILLCGGSGTLLWPLSPKSFPKQFGTLLGKTSLFQLCAERLSRRGFNPPTVVTTNDFRFIVTQQLDGIGISDRTILIEPEGRITAPAILAAALRHANEDPSALMFVTPTDHVVPDATAFRETIAQGVEAAKTGRIVTFGATPSRPETGYGYPEIAGEDGTGVAQLKRFVEKLDAATAKTMLTAREYFWIAGIFLFSAQTIITTFKIYQPKMLALVGSGRMGCSDV